MDIPFHTPMIDSADASAVYDVVKSTWLTQGEQVPLFEESFAKYVGAKHAVAVSSGTAALHLACIEAGLGLNDEAVVPSFSFIATANAVLYCSARPVFADIDAHSLTVSPPDVEKKLTSKTKAIIPVHYGGQVADMQSICEIAEETDLLVIEDAAEAHGACLGRRSAGNLGHIAAFSFTPIKSMTTGEGGMITTNNEETAEQLRRLRNHGSDKPYHHVSLGYNYRMTEMQAALGISQLNRLEAVTKKKNEIARQYDKELGEVPQIIVPWRRTRARHGYMLYTIRVSRSIRDHLIEALMRDGIETRATYFPPIHLQPCYVDELGYTKGSLPLTEKISKEIISLPISPGLTRDEITFITERIIQNIAQ